MQATKRDEFESAWPHTLALKSKVGAPAAGARPSPRGARQKTRTGTAQARLGELLASNARQQLAAPEAAELDLLLERVDQLTILKTRARFTLQHQQAGA
jgi:hypothetical protein